MFKTKAILAVACAAALTACVSLPASAQQRRAPTTPQPQPQPAQPQPALPPMPAPKPPAAGQAAVELERWEAPESAWAISYPKGWTAPPPEQGGGGTVTFTGPPDAGGGRPDAVTVTTGGATQTDPKVMNTAAGMKAWVESVRSAAQSKVTDFKLISENQTTVAGARGVRVVFDGKDTDGSACRGIHVAFEKGANSYAITYLLDPKRFSKFLPIEQAVTRSFVIAPKPGAGGATAAATTGTDKPAAATTDAGPMKNEAGTEFESWTSPDGAFSLAHPKTWAVKATRAANVVAAFSNPEVESDPTNGEALMVTAGTVPGADPSAAITAENFKTWAAGVRTGLSGSVAKFKLVSEDQATLGGAVAARFVFEGEEAKGNIARFNVWMLQKGATLYGLTFITSPQRTTDFGPTEQAIARSFAFGAKPNPVNATDAAAPAATVANADPAPKPATPATPTPATPATPAPAAADGTAFENAELGIKLSHPAAWAPRKTAAPGMVLMLLPTQVRPGARPSTLVLTADPVGEGQPPSFKQQADSALGALKATAMPDAKVLESTDVRVGKTPARRVLIGGHSGAAKVDTRALYVFVPHRGNVLTLTGQSTAEDFNALKEAFDAVVASMELTTPAVGPKKPQ